MTRGGLAALLSLPPALAVLVLGVALVVSGVGVLLYARHTERR